MKSIILSIPLLLLAVAPAYAGMWMMVYAEGQKGSGLYWIHDKNCHRRWLRDRYMHKVTRIFPVFAVSDLDAALDFYRDKLGFSVAWMWGNPARRAGVCLDDIEIHLDCAGPGAPSGPSVAYCHMTDVDAYYADCEARGVNFILDLNDRPWGMRDFRVADPDGNRLGFGSLLSPQRSS